MDGASADRTRTAPSSNARAALNVLGDAPPAVDVPTGSDSGLLYVVHAQWTLPLQTKG